MQTLLVHRTGVLFDGDWLGPVLELPAPPAADALDMLGEQLANDDALAAHLGLDRELATVGRVSALWCFGLHDRSPWEDRMLAWIAARLGVEPPAPLPMPSGPFSILAAKIADPLARWDDPPPGLGLLHGEDFELEALGAARWLRRKLLEQPDAEWHTWLEGVVVLVPDDPERLALWRQTLEAAGLPVRSRIWRGLHDTAIGRWTLALARLAGQRSFRRDDLQGALESPFFRMAQGTVRADVRNLLRTIRRPTVTLADLERHATAWFGRLRRGLESRDTIDDDERTSELADLSLREAGFAATLTSLRGLGAEGRFAWSNFRALCAEKVQQAFREAGQRAEAIATDQVFEVLGELAMSEVAADAVHPTLQEALQSRGRGVRTRPESGVVLTTWAAWDGCGGHHVVLAGLEEGGWPANVPTPTRRDQLLAAALGLGSPADARARQGQVARRALASAGEAALLTWSDRDARDSETFPGALLAGLPRSDEDLRAAAWTAHVTHVCERDVFPASPLESFLPHELRLWPQPAEQGDAAWREAAHLRRMARQVAEARAPSVADTPFGPWSGDVGAPPQEQAWSATSLEVLGQCPAKFFHARLLRAERSEDAGSLLDAMEAGTLVHDALAESALSSIRRDGTWRLHRTEGGTVAANADLQTHAVTHALERGIARALTEQPTLGPGITAATGTRWRGVLAGYLKGQAKTERGVPLTLDGVDLAQPLDIQAREHVRRLGVAPDQLAAYDALTAKWGRTLEVLDAIRASPTRTQDAAVTVCKQWEGHALTQVLAKRAIASDDALHAVRLELEAAHGKACDVADERLRAELRKLQKQGDAVPRDVVAAEWAFGMPRRSDGPSDPRSVEEAWEVTVHDGPPLLVKGRIDRVDADLARRRFEVVDYKTGADADDPVKNFGAGLHLQLPLYARAVTALLAPQWPGDAPITAVAGRLDLPRKGVSKALTFDEARWVDVDAMGSAPADEASTLDADTVLTRHLSVSAHRLRTGSFPLAPRACPLRDAGAHCDLARSCGFDPGAAELVADTKTPTFVPPARRSRTPKPRKPFETPVRLDPPCTPPSAEDGFANARVADATIDDLEHDVIVSAGAGSGKTTRLVRRYVRAIASGAMPDGILAITFTRKATAEMRVRVREALLRNDVGLDDEARRSALLALGSAPILTIDAFAAHVVRCLAPDSVGAVSDSAGAFNAGWVEGRLVEACDAPSPEVRRLLETLAVPHVRQLLTAWVELEPARLQALAARTLEDLVDGWRRAFDRTWPEVTAEADALTAMLPEVVVAQARGGLRPADAEQLGGLVVWLQRLAALRSAFGGLGALAGLSHPGSSAADRPVAKPFVEAAHAVHHRWGASGRSTTSLHKALAATVKDDSEPVAALQRALLHEADTTRAAARVAASWQSELADARALRGIVVHRDIQHRATELLHRATHEPALADEVRAQLGYAHLLVDELQDTSRAQVELFDALTHALAMTGRAPVRFYVGDLKQSIYRFRGAEVDVFAAEQQAPERRLTSLDTCWRARPSLTRAVDRLFERVLAPRAEGAPTDSLAAVPWEPLAPRSDAHGDEDADDGTPPFELLGTPAYQGGAEGDDTSADDDEDDPSGGAPLQAEVTVTEPVIARIRELRTEHPDWSIAVLVHGWRLAGRWGEALREAGIPAFVQGGKGLLSDPTVAPLLAVLDALEREDDLGMWEVLHGPLVGVSDTGLWAIRNGAGVTLEGPGADKGPTGRVALRRLRFGFSFDADAAACWLENERGSALPSQHRQALHRDAAQIARWRAWWTTARRTFGRAPATAWLDSLLASTGYPAQLADAPVDLARVRLNALRRFRGELNEAEKQMSHRGSLVRELRRRREAEDDPSATSNPYPGRAVTVTVVHQAKGLAWDVVVLPNPDKATVKADEDAGSVARVLDADGTALDLAATRQAHGTDLFLSRPSMSSALVALARAPWERAELRRLLYVACTRARERVVVGGLPTQAADIARMMHGWANRAGRAPTHRHARSWRDDLLLAVGIDCHIADGIVTWGLQDDAWVEGRDYRWVQPRPSAPTPVVAAETLAWPEDLARRLRSVEPVEIPVLNPSAAKGMAPPRPIEDLGPAVAGAPTRHPFPNARMAGTVVHRAFATWAWDGEPSEAAVKAAIGDTLPATWIAAHDQDRAAAWVLEVLLTAEATQAALATRLHEAARRGDVRHEARVQVTLDGQRVEGSIDLLWRDAEGAWHLLDYKATEAPHENDAQDSLDARIRHYYPQVATYARAVRAGLPRGERLATFGLWFVREGRLVRWSADAPEVA